MFTKNQPEFLGLTGGFKLPLSKMDERIISRTPEIENDLSVFHRVKQGTETHHEDVYILLCILYST